MTFFESPDGMRRPPRPAATPKARRTSRILFLVSAALAFAFFGSFYLDELPLPVRTWVAETVPAARELVGIAPDPDQEVADLADRMFLTDEGRAVFYRTQPHIVGAAELADDCLEDDEMPGDFYQAGCYLGIDRIFILREQQPVMVTTAAHELLHAAYGRLGSGERARIDALVTVEMARVPASDPVHEQIEASVGDDPDARPDERFAYLGSQVVLDGGFSPELEAVYAQWFTDRSSLAALDAR